MELFYRQHKKKIIFTVVLFILAVFALLTNRILIKEFSEVSIQADISFWIASLLLLATVAMGIFLMILEYVQVRK